MINGDTGSGCAGDRFSSSRPSAFSGPLPDSLGLESGRNYMIGCPDKTTDLAIARTFKLGGARTAQFRVEMYNAFNVVVYQRAADAAAAGQPDQSDDPQLAVPRRRERRSQPAEDHERRVRRRDRGAAAANDPGAAAILVLME